MTNNKTQKSEDLGFRILKKVADTLFIRHPKINNKQKQQKISIENTNSDQEEVAQLCENLENYYKEIQKDFSKENDGFQKKKLFEKLTIKELTICLSCVFYTKNILQSDL